MKSKRLTIRLTEKDLEKIRELAEFAQKSVSDFVVESCLNGNMIQSSFIKQIDLLKEEIKQIKTKIDKNTSKNEHLDVDEKGQKMFDESELSND
jgi:uncharacterized protein (DUF1778 family)